MAIFAVAITKSVSFRGVQQEFTNVYHYSGTLPGVSQAAAVAAALKTKEVQYHSSDVTFVRYKVWSAGGSSGSNVMIDQGNLSGTGSQTVNSSMDRERAVLIRVSNGIDVRGRPVYLRKWYHSCGDFAGVSFSGGLLQNTTQISSANRTAIASLFQTDFLSPTISGVTYNLCSARGTAGGTPITCHPYLEHHQLGEMWR